MKTYLKKMKFIPVFVLLAFGFGNHAYSQLFTGGDLSATFINGVKINLAPTIGYKILNSSSGFSPIIQYTAASPQGFAGDFSYGGRLFEEYDIWNGILFHAEFRAMNTGFVNEHGFKQHGWVMGVPLGVGYEYQISLNVWFKGLVLYDPLVHANFYQNTPNPNPTVSGGITYVF